MLQELREEPVLSENYEEMSGGSGSALQELEEDPGFSGNHEEMTEFPRIPVRLLETGGLIVRRIETSPIDEPVRYDRCGYQDVLDHLKLSKSNDLFSMSRPVKNHTSTTEVFLAMAISAILDVRERDQTFVSYIWIHMSWNNEHIRWNPAEFCQIKHMLVPTDVLWKPDIIIEEMIEKDKAPPSDLIKIRSNGDVEYRNDQVVISSCKMRVYKFPFDVQSCNLSIKSLMHSDDELYFSFISNTTALTELSRMVMQTQYEWLFINMTATSKTDNVSIDMNQTSVIHTIYMRRRSLLYIANFLMPVLFFLCLDLSSFLISESGGEKLGFKVTVLLAVTVMQLILNEILPCSSERVPLIAVYCIGIFTFMMLSLLETILVMHLMEKDACSTSRQNVQKLYRFPKKPSTDSLKDYRPIALIAIMTKCFEKLLAEHIKTKLPPTLNPHQFAYRANRSTEDANAIALHKALSHLKHQGNYVRMLFIDISSSFNTTISDILDSTSQLTEVSLALGKVSDELEQIEKTMMATE
ncbi:5-hydroxytryptamine receptor 3A-like [Salarias fasciatus]|uniref:5-hydroxytryptamine receptor 3A-like n=1 Tax=Salarias fasciatus TaxID=181472 RepID=UPI00117675CA|nr:5-hydroxytryptamine receptor 3A-like [Salarias fasciatus]